ncbi:hypothetical protein CPB83DRAFT_844695 [Crepidotus variabilis]|uniref:Uncharacterized protein n=1 Tax=Crepidotus variabilis TaxID=179855 RepID=A0A9P6ES13_9AGAR|nr:hypothetical protein CPB83DRAFT_844695 [Crepidotus variabilis]
MVRLTQAALIVALSLPAALANVHLIARQLPGLGGDSIPQACADKCQAFTTTVNGNPSCLSDLACLCDAKVAQGLSDCVTCGYAISPDLLNGTTPDALIKQYSDGCSAAGHPVTIASSAASGTGSAGAGSATVTKSGSGTATGAGSGTTAKTSGTSTSSSSGSSASAGSTNGAVANTWSMVGAVAAVAAGAAAFL